MEERKAEEERRRVSLELLERRKQAIHITSIYSKTNEYLQQGNTARNHTSLGKCSLIADIWIIPPEARSLPLLTDSGVGFDLCWDAGAYKTS